MTLTNADIKLVRSLATKKGRDETGMFVVEGEKMVAEAASAPGWEVIKVIRRDDVGEQAMRRISLMDNGSPALAIVRKPQRQAEAELVPGGLYLGLDSVRDPGNLGTIVRMADWFGVDGIFCSPDCVDLYNPKTVQATMGGIFRVGVTYTPLDGVCRRFSASGMKVYGTFLDGDDIYREAFTPSGLILMGNESNGISAAVGALADSRLLIPKAPGSRAESLNVAMAASLIVAEFKRRASK